MKTMILIAALLLSGCARKLPSTPSYMRLDVTAATCDVLPIASTGPVIGECRYTVETGGKMEIRQIEFRRVRGK
jgi:hypothetical protein